MASHPHKPIFYPSNSYDGSNFIRIIWSGNQVEEYTTQNCLECHQYADYSRIINIRRSVSGILHILIGVALWCKLQIQPDIDSNYTDGEIRYMYKAVKKTNAICRYMESLAFHTGATPVHWEDRTSCIYVVYDKKLTLELKTSTFLSVLCKKTNWKWSLYSKI